MATRKPLVIVNGQTQQLQSTDSLTSASLASGGVDGQTLKQTSGVPAWSDTFIEVICVFNGAGTVLLAGLQAEVVIPTNGTIVSVTMLADVVGSAVVDVWKDTYANYPPTIADTIVASAPPTLSAANKSQDSTLTGWTTSIVAGDIIKFNLNSNATITRLSVTLKVKNT